MLNTQIKICGLSTVETIDAAVEAGATHIGLMHFKPSKRHVTLKKAAKLRERIPDSVKTVLVTVNMEPKPTAEILQAVQPDVLQLHGDETPEWLALLKEKAKIEIWKAVGIKDRASLERTQKFAEVAHMLLYDAAAGSLPGGSGLALDWRLLMGHKHALPWGLAGGLNASNVGDAIRYTGAKMVDTSSGVESEPGKKDPAKITAFCEAVRAATQ